MGTSAPAVVHLDTGMEWRGGQQQAAWLHEGLLGSGVPSLMVSPGRSPLGAWCRNRGLPWKGMRLGGEWNIAAGIRLAALCRRTGSSLVHAHTSHALGIAHWARLFRPSLRIVVTRRLDFHVGANALSRWKYCTPRLAAIVCVSEGVRRVLLADGIPGDKLVVIHDGIDARRFDGSRAVAGQLSSLPPGTIVVGTIAALVGHKDYPTLLRAARVVLDAQSDVVFCALGDGGQRQLLDELHRQLGLGERFLFAGFQDDPGAWLRRFDIFVLASKEEGMGSSLLDAMAMGIPVVATRAGGIPDVVRDGVNGVLVPVGDHAALAEAIVRLAGDSVRRQTLGSAGRACVGQYSMTGVVERHAELYRRVLAADHGLPAHHHT